MDIFLLIVAIICLLIGLIGCIAPVLPGPPISLVGLLLFKLTRFGSEVTWTWIIIFAAMAIVVTILDYLVPVWGTKKFGGTSAGVWGTTIGLIIGLFFSPVGIIVGPFLGAFIGEWLAGQSTKHSLRAAFGAFIGFLLGVGLKLLVSAWIAVYFIMHIF